MQRCFYKQKKLKDATKKQPQPGETKLSPTTVAMKHLTDQNSDASEGFEKVSKAPVSWK